jgi:hypothetical protein
VEDIFEFCQKMALGQIHQCERFFRASIPFTDVGKKTNLNKMLTTIQSISLTSYPVFGFKDVVDS